MLVPHLLPTMMTFGVLFAGIVAIGTSSEVDSGGYCESELSCICISNALRKTVHCEGIVDFNFVSIDKPNTIYVTCFSGSVNDAEFDFVRYAALLRLTDHPNDSALTVNGCPPPIRGSYSNITDVKSGAQSLSQVPNPIQMFKINCEGLESFYLTKAHLSGLTGLKVMTIVCPVQCTLPTDLLDDVSRSLQRLEIRANCMEQIPRAFFARSSKLVELLLRSNQIKAISEDSFVGLDTLKKLDLSSNMLTHLGDNIFLPLSKLRYLNMSDNALASMPSTKYLHTLISLDLSRNAIKRVRDDDCFNLRLLKTLLLGKNNIDHIGRRCLTWMSNISRVDWSFNRIGERLEPEVVHERSTVPPLMSLPPENSDNGGERMGSILADMFANNYFLEIVNMERNNLESITGSAFANNSELIYINMASNKFVHLPSKILDKSHKLEFLNLSNNRIEVLPDDFLIQQRRLYYLNLSRNKIKYLNANLFIGPHYSLKELDLSENLIQVLPKGLFSPLSESGKLERLNLGGNQLSYWSSVPLINLRHLNLTRNDLQGVEKGAIHFLPRLTHLTLSFNSLDHLGNASLLTRRHALESLDLSYNAIRRVPEGTFSEGRIRVLNLSGNALEKFFVDNKTHISEVMLSVECLDISRNKLIFFGYHNMDILARMLYDFRGFHLKQLDLSHNSLSFNNSFWIFDHLLLTWGRISPLRWFSKLEVLELSNNSIEAVFMDLRNGFPSLRHVDLRHNRIKFLSYQDILFSSGQYKQLPRSAKLLLNIRGASPSEVVFREYPTWHSLTVDLRHNLIKGIELPQHMLKDISWCSKEERKLRQHVTLLIGNNPFLCGCQVFPLLRIIGNESRVTSEAERTYGQWTVLAAKIDATDLKCWEPLSIRGKNVSEPETWLHHVLPLYGICQLLTPPSIL